MAHKIPWSVKRFARDVDASVTVEFVIALPVLLAMLAFSVQYGNALKVRNNLDVATRDAARYLARAPLDPTGTSVDQIFIDRARQIIADRVATSKATVASFSGASDITAASVDVTINVPFPLLTYIGLFNSVDANIPMAASENWTRTGDTIVTTATSGGT